MDKKLIIIFICLVFVAAGFAQTLDVSSKKILFVYDKEDKALAPYQRYFRDAIKAADLDADEVTAENIGSKNLAQYDLIIIHSAVMAFTWKSPVRDWLKTNPNLAGKKVALLVTAKYWFLDEFKKQILDLLKKSNVDLVDAVSAATNKLNDKEKNELVNAQIDRLKK